jgi:hypothetical protein
MLPRQSQVIFGKLSARGFDLLSAGVVRQPVHEFLQFGLKATEMKSKNSALVTSSIALARIWREILKLIRLTFPFFGIYRRVAFDSYIGPGFCIISVELEPLLGSVLGVGLDRFDRTFWLTYPAIDAFVGMDDEHVFALVETIDGANLHAIHQLALDAGFIDDISQMSSSLWQRQPLSDLLVLSFRRRRISPFLAWGCYHK